MSRRASELRPGRGIPSMKRPDWSDDRLRTRYRAVRGHQGTGHWHVERRSNDLTCLNIHAKQRDRRDRRSARNVARAGGREAWARFNLLVGIRNRGHGDTLSMPADNCSPFVCSRLARRDTSATRYPLSQVLGIPCKSLPVRLNTRRCASLHPFAHSRQRPGLSQPVYLNLTAVPFVVTISMERLPPPRCS